MVINMSQQIYGNLNGKQNKKGKKLLIILLCIAAAVVVVLAIIGFTVGANPAERQYISSAITENTQLRLQIDQLNEEIEKLNEEITRLGGELELRPTIAPEPYSVPDGIMEAVPTATPAVISPRNY